MSVARPQGARPEDGAPPDCSRETRHLASCNTRPGAGWRFGDSERRVTFQSKGLYFGGIAPYTPVFGRYRLYITTCKLQNGGVAA